ncbi:hypothetical protein SAMN06265355_109262 [Actinomadura mexicana]|uniref:Uncharacterized protein n=1 Tax=Actinomadura mexicana TaxID=134959 RepID=A0A239AX32_9ACTN|nr:hypothetical protein SAMN06265355_109262 [Actinomadura mexicana]
MSQCQKCYRTLQDCPGCNGGRAGVSPLGDRLTCNKCRNTGQVCPEHEGHWKK